MIATNNFIRILEKEKMEFHSAIFTCYTFDPLFFSTFYLPILRKKGIRNIIVIQDASRYDELLMDKDNIKNLYSNNFTLVRQAPSNQGVFHPKITLLVGKDNGILMLGSGNLTYSGMSKNTEIWGILKYDSSNNYSKQLLYNVWTYINSFSEDWTETAKEQLKLIINKSWIKDHLAENNAIIQIEGNELTFISNDKNGSIFKKLRDLLKGKSIERVEIISPFYDKAGVLVNSIQKEFAPKEIKCVIDNNGTYPTVLMNNKIDGLSFYKWDSVRNNSISGPLHAKIIQLKAGDEYYLLYGSANAGENAFGSNGIYKNDEACFFMHNSNYDYLFNLGFFINDDALYTIKDSNDFPEKEYSTNLSTNEILITQSELQFGKLTVHANKKMDGYKVVVFDLNMKEIGCFDCCNSSKVFTVKYSGPQTPYFVVITNNNEQKSNYSLVHQYNIVLKANPDNTNIDKFEKLAKYFNDDNLLAIANYIDYNSLIEKKNESVPKHSMQNTETKDAGAELIDLEALKKYNNSGNIKSKKKNNVFFNAMFTSIAFLDDIMERKVDTINTNVEKDSEEGEQTIEQTEPSDKEKNPSQDEKSDEEKNLISMMNHSKTLKRSLDVYFGNFDTALQTNPYATLCGPNNEGLTLSDNCVKPFKVLPSINNYVAIALYSGYLCNSLKNVEKKDINAPLLAECKDLFVSNYGRFLLYNYDGYNGKIEASEIKKYTETFDSCTIYSLIFMCLNRWNKKTNMLILLLLNTFDSYRENMSRLNEVIGIFNSQIKDYKCFELDTLEILKIIYEGYVSWRKNNDQKPQEIKLSWDSQFIYKSGYGFIFAKRILHCIRPPFKFILYHPGFSGIECKTEIKTRKLLIINDSKWINFLDKQ